MQDKEIIQKWKAGLSKDKLAKTYRREYNMQIRNIRAEVRHRHSRKIYNKLWSSKQSRASNI